MKAVNLALVLMMMVGMTMTASAQQNDETAARPGKLEEKSNSSALRFKMKSLGGDEVNLNKYKGDVLLIVNTASKCGLTPQYRQLQELHEQYGDKGLSILGFPCNQFGNQEPGTAEEIQKFCQKNYGVKFDMFSKIDVNGEDRCELYKYLTGLDLKPKGKGDVKWNFEKFVVDRKGEPIARFGPRTKPDDPELMKVIKGALEEN